MSNPTINRWGLNLFWYSFWYKDKTYQLTVHQDKLFTKLLHIYLNYGLLHPHSIFANRFWYARLYEVTNYFMEHSVKYFRTMHFKSPLPEDDEDYTIRNKTKNTYMSRVWLLRYQGWIIFNFYCFQPPRKKNLKAIKNHYIYKNTNFFFSPLSSSKFIYKRIKLIIYYFLAFPAKTASPYFAF